MDARQLNIALPLRERINSIIDSERWFQGRSGSQEIPYSSSDLASEALNNIYVTFRSRVFQLSSISIDNFGVFNTDITTETVFFTEDACLRRMIDEKKEILSMAYFDYRQLDDELLKTILAASIIPIYDARTGYSGESEAIVNVLLGTFFYMLCLFLINKKQIDLVGIGKLFLDCKMRVIYEPNPDFAELIQLGKLQFLSK